MTRGTKNCSNIIICKLLSTDKFTKYYSRQYCTVTIYNDTKNRL